MSTRQFVDYVWGRPSSETPTVPLHYPLIAVCTILAAIAPSTWLLSVDQGYLLSGAILTAVLIYGVVFTNVRLSTNAVFCVFFGGYYAGLVAHYWLHNPHSELLYILISTPIAVIVTVVILPQFVTGRRQTFTMGLTLAGAVVAVVGVLVLWMAGTADTGLPESVGMEIMGLYGIRTVSVFKNPNPYGFFMMVGSLAALYTVLERGGAAWLAALGLCLMGLVMSEGDAALIGLVVGSIIVLSGRHYLISLSGIGLSVITVYVGIRIGHVPEVMQTTLMSRVERWVTSLELLAETPLWGFGFEGVGEAMGGEVFNHSEFFPPLSSDTGSSNGPHNSYVYPLLSTGVIAGSLYLSSLVYALACGIRKHWTQWNAFVVGTASAIYVYMAFESHFLGGVGVSSVTFGLFIGLMLLTEPDISNPEPTSATAREPLGPSRARRAVRWLQTKANGEGGSADTQQ